MNQSISSAVARFLGRLRSSILRITRYAITALLTTSVAAILVLGVPSKRITDPEIAYAPEPMNEYHDSIRLSVVGSNRVPNL